MNRIVLISSDNCNMCITVRPKAETLASEFQCRFIEYNINDIGSQNYDIEGTPQLYLEDSSDNLIYKSPPGNRGIDEIKKQLKK